MGHRIRVFMKSDHELISSKSAQKQFIGAVARLADAQPQDVKNSSFRDGCVIFEAELDSRHAEAFHRKYQALRDSGPSRDKNLITEFAEQYRVTNIDVEAWWQFKRKVELNMKIGFIVGPFGETEFRALVTETVQRFEQEHDVMLTVDAVEALVLPGLPMLDHVDDELQSGKITREFLQDSLNTLLSNAKAVDGVIDEEQVEESKEKYCPYLFWC